MIKEIKIEGYKLRDELENNLKKNKWYISGVTKRRTDKFIKKIRKNFLNLYNEIESIPFQKLLITYPKLKLISNEKELYLWFIEYIYTYIYDCTLSLVKFLKNEELFYNRIYKINDMTKILNEYSSKKYIPEYAHDFKKNINSNEMIKIIRKKKLKQINNQ